MNAVKTVGDLVIQESDIIKALNNGLSDTNQRMEKHYDELRLFKHDMLIQSVKTEEQIKSMKLFMISGFVVLLATMGYVINRLDRSASKD